MGDLDIDAIRQREQAADPAPWTAHPDGLVWSQLIGDPVSGSALIENAEFIAAARTAVPALLAKVDELTEHPASEMVWLGDLAGYQVGPDDHGEPMLWHRCGWNYDISDPSGTYLANLLSGPVAGHSRTGCAPPPT